MNKRYSGTTVYFISWGKHFKKKMTPKCSNIMMITRIKQLKCIKITIIIMSIIISNLGQKRISFQFPSYFCFKRYLISISPFEFFVLANGFHEPKRFFGFFDHVRLLSFKNFEATKLNFLMFSLKERCFSKLRGSLKGIFCYCDSDKCLFDNRP